MRPIRYLLLSLLILLFACSNKPGLSESEKNYYRNMSQVHSEMLAIQSLSQSNKFAKVRYQEAVSLMKPKAQTLLRRFKGTEFEDRASYKVMMDAFQSYVIAEYMWDQDKGLALVNKRLAEGNFALDKAQKLLQQEQHPKSDKPNKSDKQE